MEITYPAELPIVERREELLEVLRAHQVVVVAGETGSGKSTQLPKMCLELGRGEHALIGHTQPRRVAARSIAERVASELNTPLGELVGYAVRFTDKVGPNTRIKVMTDGILLAEIQRDRMLRKYDTLIIDEAHERSLNVDFLLGYLKQLLPKRPDLKLIITSATIDTARFSEHFDGAPVIAVEGRTYPVEVRYRPFGEEPDDDRDQVTAICDAVEELARVGAGDVLVFLSGEREIHDTADALKALELRNTDVLPLYARLSAAEQHRIFEQHAGRRIVLSTNVAETSLTVPGARYVIDTGTARISRYSRRLKVQRLPIEPISQASANQRSGRCGRVAAGVAIRLYAEEDFDARPAFTEPEILRTNLASVILQMTALGLGDIAAFPFVEPPDKRSIKDGIMLLEELGALETEDADVPARRLTKLGKRLARLPLDPRLGRMVLEADRLSCVREVMILSAALSIQDPRERPQDKLELAMASHARFNDESSDFLSLIKLWDYLRAKQKELTSNQFRKLCRNEYLNYLRVREWQDLYSQLRQVCSSIDVRMGTENGHPDRIHQALLSGLLSQIGNRETESREFTGARGAKFMIAPGSMLARKPPKWTMVAELVETNRLWGRRAARIQPEWAEHLGEHLVKRTYGEPMWDAQRGCVVTTERVMLYGLAIVAGRRVDYARFNTRIARELFIRHALVQGEWTTHQRFFHDNRGLIEELRELEERVRRRDLLVGDEVLFAFYDDRVGADVTSTATFNKWWKKTVGAQPELLRATRDLLLQAAAKTVRIDDFPGTWVAGDIELDVTYTFEPGTANDGVTVQVPLAVLNRIQADGFDWHVAGYREELVTALIRTLPKTTRRHLVPAGDHARAVMPDVLIASDTEPLVTVLARALGRSGGIKIKPSDFEQQIVPDHLRITFAVHDERGKAIATGKDLEVLRVQLRGRNRAAIAEAASTVEASGLTSWTIGSLPQFVEVDCGGHAVRGYPALIDEGASVAVRVLTDPALQAVAMRTGLRRLVLLTTPINRQMLEHRIAREAKLALLRHGRVTVNQLLDDCVTCAADFVVTRHGDVWDAESFKALSDLARQRMAAFAGAAVATMGDVLIAASNVESRLDQLTALSLQPVVNDARNHLDRLVRSGIATNAGLKRLPDILRYIKGIERRTAKLDLAKDLHKLRDVLAVETDYYRMLNKTKGPVSADMIEFGWMLEEFRVATFAQTLGTNQPVSLQRLRKELIRLELP
jgi:ATP-dependent helicase HrpA